MNTKLDKYVTAVILAAGSGTRMMSDKTKQKMDILGESVLSRSTRAFCECPLVDSVVVVVRSDEMDFAKSELSSFDKVVKIVEGGDTRRESAKKGFSAIPEKSELVAIHDGARCLVTPEMIEEVILAASVTGAATAASGVVDTVKLSTDGYIEKTLPRDNVFLAATPQIFSVDLYKKALEKTEKDVTITDDNMMLEALGVRVALVNTGSQNIKITTKDDVELAEFILEKRRKNG